MLLEVVEGRDAGARLHVDDRVRVVGRSKTADLVVSDLTVSRLHLQVCATASGVLVASCEGASAFIAGGVSHRQFEASVGDKIFVGNTILRVTASGVEPAQQPEPPGTGVQTLLTGMGADALALASIYALIDRLDAAQDRASLTSALQEWAEDQRPTLGVSIEQAAIVKDGLAGSVEGDALHVTVPAPSPTPLSIVFTGHRERPPTDSLRRMLVVAGRLFGSALSRVHRAEVADGEVAALRALSFGTAREFVGSSSAASQLASKIPRLAASDVNVLLEGETGVGKTFVVRLLHESGARAKEPLRIVNCASIPESLAESELFGHERGAFTGAASQRIGALESAGRGTLFLDEIGELSLGVQAKLLRALEERKFERLGSNRTIDFRARLVSATNRDLDAMIASQKFRQDLLFRIAVVRLRVPPLRERDDDVIALAKQLLSDAARAAGRRIAGFSPEALTAIRAYSWPGNVRELRNAIEHAIVNCDAEVIEVNALPDAVLGAVPRDPGEGTAINLPVPQAWLDERNFEAALTLSRGNITKAAALLGMNRVSLHKRLRRRRA